MPPLGRRCSQRAKTRMSTTPTQKSGRDSATKAPPLVSLSMAGPGGPPRQMPSGTDSRMMSSHRHAASSSVAGMRHSTSCATGTPWTIECPKSSRTAFQI